MEVKGQLHAPAALPPLETRLGGPTAVLDAVVKRKIPSPCRDSNIPIIQSVAQRCTTELSRLFPTKSVEKKILQLH
jgi:hypothetical protein